MSDTNLPKFRPVLGSTDDPRPMPPDIALPTPSAIEINHKPGVGSKEEIRQWADELLTRVTESLEKDQTDQINQILKEVGAGESSSITSTRPIMEAMKDQLERLKELIDNDAPLDGEDGIHAKQQKIVELTQRLQDELRNSQKQTSELYRSNESHLSEEQVSAQETNYEKRKDDEVIEVQLALDRARVHLSELAQLMHLEHGVNGGSAVGKKMVELRSALTDIEQEVANC